MYNLPLTTSARSARIRNSNRGWGRLGLDRFGLGFASSTMSTQYTLPGVPPHGLRIDDFEIDDYNTEHMANHRVTPEEVYEVLWSGTYKIFANTREHAAAQPYIMQGLTDGGRVLQIPIQRTAVEGIWRPATAKDPTRHQYRN